MYTQVYQMVHKKQKTRNFYVVSNDNLQCASVCTFGCLSINHPRRRVLPGYRCTDVCECDEHIASQSVLKTDDADAPSQPTKLDLKIDSTRV